MQTCSVILLSMFASIFAEIDMKNAEVDVNRHQKWLITPTGSDREGIVVEIKSIHSTKCVDSKQSSSVNDNPIEQVTCNHPHSSTAQKWVVIQKGTHFSLVNILTRKCIGVYNESTGNGARIIQYRCNGNLDQDWYYQNSCLINRQSQKCLIVQGGSTANNVQLQQSECDWECTRTTSAIKRATTTTRRTTTKKPTTTTRRTTTTKPTTTTKRTTTAKPTTTTKRTTTAKPTTTTKRTTTTPRPDTTTRRTTTTTRPAITTTRRTTTTTRPTTSELPNKCDIEQLQSEGPWDFVCPAPHGKFQDVCDCRFYYACDNGEVADHIKCPEGLLFNPTINNCDYELNVDCDN